MYDRSFVQSTFGYQLGNQRKSFIVHGGKVQYKPTGLRYQDIRQCHNQKCLFLIETQKFVNMRFAIL
ncbi:MAG: hypothetical protein DRR19_10085 [Candidatus Parabeggiatoa sp. nov. 1]|nr:MAG: hypothetical protein DRR19_10085 [Gammaproteobacteria bacterium]